MRKTQKTSRLPGHSKLILDQPQKRILNGQFSDTLINCIYPIARPSRELSRALLNQQHLACPKSSNGEDCRRCSSARVINFTSH